MSSTLTEVGACSGRLAPLQFLANHLANSFGDIGGLQRGLQSLVDQRLVTALSGHVLEMLDEGCIEVERYPLLRQDDTACGALAEHQLPVIDVGLGDRGIVVKCWRSRFFLHGVLPFASKSPEEKIYYANIR